MKGERGRFTVCVYCGSRTGALPAYAEAARTVGREIGRRGWGMVYGGGRVGLMGIAADAALAAGAPVAGVIPRTLLQREVGHQGLTELEVVETMHARKQRMAERADAFVALPGGIGTLEELFEVWTWRQLGDHDQPIGLLDVADYYRPLLDFLARADAQDFVSAGTLGLVDVASDPVALLDRLAACAGSATRRDEDRLV